MVKKINLMEIQKIQKIIEEFFDKMNFSVEIQLKPLEKETLPVDIKTSEPQILIGEKGETLVSIQRLLKVLLRRKLDKNLYIDLDINGYKKKKIDYLRQLARSVADDVALTKKEQILPPMPAYERRIIHLELAERGNVVTESIGQEPQRRVVIRPY
ncbi:KH domain-containing protein [bacterium]|nr:KH domain-containing protein [bacterium]